MKTSPQRIRTTTETCVKEEAQSCVQSRKEEQERKVESYVKCTGAKKDWEHIMFVYK